MASDRHEFVYFGVNRYLCTVLDEMRELNKTRNYSALEGLIEEAQILGNRMESALSDMRDYRKVQEDLPKAKKAYKDLKREYRALEKELEKLEAKRPKSKSQK